MVFKPDYHQALSEVMRAIMPKTLGDWVLIALILLGLFFVIIVLEAVKEYITRTKELGSRTLSKR